MNYIFVKNWTTKKGATGQTAYKLDEYMAEGDATALIAASSAAYHPSQVDLSGMKKKRILGDDVLYGVN